MTEVKQMPKLTQEQLIAKYDAMYEYEKDCLSKGFKMIGGIDEAGRGPLHAASLILK